MHLYVDQIQTRLMRSSQHRTDTVLRNIDIMALHEREREGGREVSCKCIRPTKSSPSMRIERLKIK